MASSYTTLFRLEQMANGEKTNTWGQIENLKWVLMEEAVAGMEVMTVTGGTKTLTATNGASDESRNAILKFVGTLASNQTIVIPSNSKLYIIWNETQGNFTLSVKTASGLAVPIPREGKLFVFCDGVQIYQPSFAKFQSDIDGDGNTLSNVCFTNTSELYTNQGDISGAVSINYAVGGGVRRARVVDDITSFTVTNWPGAGKLGALMIHLQQNSSGSNNIAKPASWKVPGGTINLTGTANAVDVLLIWTVDAGATVYAALLEDMK